MSFSVVFLMCKRTEKRRNTAIMRSWHHFIDADYKLPSVEDDHLIVTFSIQSADEFNNDKHFWPMRNRNPCAWPMRAQRGRVLTKAVVALHPSVCQTRILQKFCAWPWSSRPEYQICAKPPVSLRFFWVMELDKMDENDWKYHGEGNKSLVVSHLQVSVQ